MLSFWLSSQEAQIQGWASHVQGSQSADPRGLGTGRPGMGPHASTHFEPRVGNEAGVVTEVGCVVLHHALCLRLAKVLVGGGKAASRQHDGRTL